MMSSDTADLANRAQFTAMADGTAEDYAKVKVAAQAFSRALPGRLMAYLADLDGNSGGFRVDRLEHSLQTASRAFRDGRDDEYVACALLHDIGDPLAPHNHSELAACVLRPFVSEENHWMVAHHNIFQGYYFYHHFGRDPNLREQYRGHPAFERTASFCALYDQVSFDPNYDTMPLSAFEPVIQRVMSQLR
jgi:predicted HD phosphohydrolase